MGTVRPLEGWEGGGGGGKHHNILIETARAREFGVLRCFVKGVKGCPDAYDLPSGMMRV